LIKRDINSPKPSGDEIVNMIEEIYTGDVEDMTTDILSPGLTVVDGLLDPLGNRTEDSSGAEQDHECERKKAKCVIPT
jgi:hypothetical protein